MASNFSGRLNTIPYVTSEETKARLQELLYTSYAKIEELHELLVKESTLKWKDCTNELDPVIYRQRILHENVIKRYMEANGKGEPTPKPPPLKFGPSRRLIDIHQVKNVSNEPPGLNAKTLSHTRSAPLVGYPPLSSRDAIKFQDLIDIQKRREKARQNSLCNTPERSIGAQVKDDNQCYGSLDRNVVKKKKHGPVDKARRHTKIVGSMAALEQTDELQPDEQYKIGLPNLTRMAGPSSRNLSSSPVAPMIVLPPKLCLTPPPIPPPKTKTAGIGRPLPPSLSEPSDVGKSVSIPRHLSESNNSVTIGTLADRSVNREMRPPARGWLETNLDESTFLPLNYGADSPQGTATSFIPGYLDTTDSLAARPPLASPATDISDKSSKSSEGNELRIFVNETIKPFEMADYYKYSTKFRQGQQSISVNQLDLTNGNASLASSGDGEEFIPSSSQADRVPKLPPRDSSMNANINPNTKVGVTSTTQEKTIDSVEDSDLGWVMDTPTLV